MAGPHAGDSYKQEPSYTKIYYLLTVDLIYILNKTRYVSFKT